MKLHEIKLGEGLIEITTLSNIELVVANGITDNAQTVILARCIMAIREGNIGDIVDVNGYLNTLFPDQALINDVKALNKEQSQQVATVILNILRTEDVKTGIVSPFNTVGDYLAYATRSEASE